MKYFYSPMKDAFYPEEFKKDYVKAGTFPTDTVEVYEEEFIKFSVQPQTQDRAYDKVNKCLVWTDRYKTSDELKNEEVIWRNEELFRADIELYKVQDSDPKAVGSVSDWRSYRKMLRAWTENESFPDSNFRPIAPDFKD